MTMASVTTEDADAQKRERVKARWSMLRQALLGSSSGSGGNDAAGTGTEHSEAKGAAGKNNDRVHEHSMNYFPGFHVLDRATITLEKEGNEFNGALIKYDDNWNTVQNSYTSTKGHKISFLTREAKEQQQTNQKSSIQSRVEALMSHRNYGVDNTGNVRVWDAEATLAGFCLSAVLDRDGACESDGNRQSAELSDLRKNLRSMITNSTEGNGGENPTCNLLELGAGQAGLAGLAIAALSVSSEDHTVSDNHTIVEEISHMKHLNVVLTDGHPKCVVNNEICAKMISRSEVTKVQIEARLLLWDSSSEGADACHQMNKLIGDTGIDQSFDTKSPKSNRRGANAAPDEGTYQLCFASDCVHFQEFHDGLLVTLARTLAVDGIALLCQPRRGTSLQNFVSLVDSVNASEEDGSIGDDARTSETTGHREVGRTGPLFRATLFEDFHPKVARMHAALVSEANEAKEHASSATNGPDAKPPRSSQYDPNRHRPLLLALQKLRQYNEDVDGGSARRHVRTRVKRDDPG